MSNNSEDIILKRILVHFENIAPKIVKESVESLSTDQPIIDYYDSDFYLKKMEGAFDDVEENKLRKIVFENIEEINAIFFKYYKTAKAP
ncbi:MAG: hypothetical protein JSV88_18580 [Candidatus Aminicenantes bacterium]|nr:MAG: hypothetical protein JSV88_18580 [Candidatus Aminicenantes bacterium]